MPHLRSTRPFLAAIGDLYGKDVRLEFFLTWLSGQGIDTLLSIGDLVDGADSLDCCCILLTAHDVLVVRGTHDRWLLKEPFAHQPGFLARAPCSSSARCR